MTAASMTLSWPRVLGELLARRDLDADTTAGAMGEILSGDATGAQIAGFAIALRAKGETAAELQGLVDAMYAKATLLDLPDRVVDIVGTGGDMAKTVTAEGTVAAADTEELSFSSAGTVTAVNVKAGDTVKAGQVLAEIDSAELEAAVADADASLADAQAKLDAQEQWLTQARGNLDEFGA